MPKVDQEGRVGSNQYVWDGSAWRRKTRRLIGKVEDLTDTVPANGGKRDYVVKADEGEVWRLVGMYLHAPAVSGATSGWHHLLVVVRPDGGNWIWKLLIESTYDNAVTYVYHRIHTANQLQYPVDEVAQGLAADSIYIGGDSDLLIRYTNYTNADQTGTRHIRLQFITV